MTARPLVPGWDPPDRLRGIGPARARALADVGIETVEDLLLVLPRRYEDRRSFARVRDLVPGGREATLEVRVVSGRLIRTRRRGFTIFEVWLEDATGRVRAVWYNQPFLAKVFTEGRRAVVFGRPVADPRRRDTVLRNPDHEFLENGETEGLHVGRVVPVYRRLAGLSTRLFRTVVYAALDDVDPDTFVSRLPREVLQSHPLLPRLEALRQVHFPAGDVDLERLERGKTPAQRTLAFEETAYLQVALGLFRHRLRRRVKRRTYREADGGVARLRERLSFPLTGAQERAVGEILADLRSSAPMNRLLQGDVGSGKTLVALIAAVAVAASGHQAALMAPTEILAEQHYHTLVDLLGPRPGRLRPALLTGSAVAAERRRFLRGSAAGEVGIAVGTHALFERDVVFRDLGLVVVDEQHRFGVGQRAALAGKGEVPDVLVMSATPIPRSLALTVYGDLDLSVLDELPPGRKPVRTVIRTEADRNRIYQGLRGELEAGRQAYVVAPLVEETEKSDLKAATGLARRLGEEVFPDFAVGLLHGRQSGEEKNAVMRSFVSGETRILVATTVVEVGVDVPNASVLVVEHAERFGLSQLHQLRGRVGRGTARSYCVLVVGNDEPGAEARQRLAVLAETGDGFRIAERDLELRGPGAVFGREQHGPGDLRFLEIALRNPDLLESARRAARDYVERHETTPEILGEILASLPAGWRRRLGLGGVG